MKQSIIKSGRPVLVKNIVGIPILLQAPAAIAAAIDDVSGGIKLTATAVSGADSYTYYASIDGGAYTEIASGQDTDYTFTPTEAGSYSFGVTAVKGSSESAMTTLTPSGLFDDVPDSEGIALMAFYEATNGDAWTGNTGWMTDSTVGNWFGVTVSGGTVTQLELPSNNLNGDISDITLAELTGLVLLDLDSNASLTDSGDYDDTITDLRISAIDGTAFLDNCAAITGYADGAHLVRVYDSSNRLLTGVLAAQGSGETLGMDIKYVFGEWDVDRSISHSDGEYTFEEDATGNPEAILLEFNNHPDMIVHGLYESQCVFTISTGNLRLDLGTDMSGYMDTSTTYTQTNTIEDLSSRRHGAVKGALGFYGTIKYNYLKQILTPSTSGATIANDTLTAKHADFVFNEANYRVQVKAL